MLPINRKYITYTDYDYPVHLMCSMGLPDDFSEKYIVLSKRPFEDLCSKIRHHFELDPRAKDMVINPSAFWVEVLDINTKTRKPDGQKYNIYLVGGTNYGLASLSDFNDDLTETVSDISNFKKCLDYNPWGF